MGYRDSDARLFGSIDESGSCDIASTVAPSTIQALTVNRGKEFTTHASIIQALEIPLYFAKSYTAWQRRRSVVEKQQVAFLLLIFIDNLR